MMPSAQQPSRGSESIEHQVHKDSCHRDIEPDGECPTSEPFVPIETSTCRMNNQNDDGRHHHGCKHDVWNKNRQVNRSDPSRTPERNRPDRRVILQIGSEEACREKQRRNHEPLVQPFVTAAPCEGALPPDCEPSKREHQGGCAVEQGVYCRATHKFSRKLNRVIPEGLGRAPRPASQCPLEDA